MPVTRHVEQHFTSGETVRDIVIGMSDGLTVPFALAAGLSGAIESTSIVITAGLAEIAAGSIAMGLGGYLAARSDAEHYASERRREQAEVRDIPAAEANEVIDVLTSYGVSAEVAAPVARALEQQPEAWIDFMMRFELGLEKPEPKRALISAVTIAAAYVCGGLVPLAPYFVFASAGRALVVSVGCTLLALFVFGYVKGHFTGAGPVRSALQTALVGGLAAAAAFGIARSIA
jgi:VIT1/CCC1 family predicted Fe2+/Mn2+ transporter